MKDGGVQHIDPEGVVAYTSVPFKDWRRDIAFA
jgi:hypothetical protein